MKQIAMLAREDFTHIDGRQVAKGSVIEVRPIDAAVLQRSGKARFATVGEVQRGQMPPIPSSPTKDLTAEKPKRTRKPRAPRTSGTTQRRDIVKAPITK